MSDKTQFRLVALALLVSVSGVSGLEAQGWTLWVGRSESWVHMRNPGCPSPCTYPTDFSIDAVRNSVSLAVRIPFKQSGGYLLSSGVGISHRGWAPGMRLEPTLYLTVPFTVEWGTRFRPTSRFGFAVGGGGETNLPVGHSDVYASFLGRGSLRAYRADGRIWELGVERTQSARGTRRYIGLASTTVFFAVPLGAQRRR